MPDGMEETRLVMSKDFDAHAAETTRVLRSSAGELKRALVELRSVVSQRKSREFYGPIRETAERLAS